MARIVHVYKDFWPPIVGGIERSINWMALGCARLYGHSIKVLVNSRCGETRKRIHEGIEIIEVGEWGRALSAPISPGFPGVMRKLEADIWHFHIPNPTGDVSWLLTRPRGAVVATYHSDVVRQKWAMGVYGPFLNAFLRKCHTIMPTSPHLIDCSPVLTKYRDKCVPVPLGMPLERFEQTAAIGSRVREINRTRNNTPFVVFVGKLRYYKGLHYLLSALRNVPNLRAVIIGEGPEGEKLKRLAAELEVDSRVEFLGELPDEEIVPYLHAAIAFVLPSHLPAEAYGLVQIEAMAAGLPVISCNLPTGVKYINQDGVTGILVTPGDDVSLAQALARMVTDVNGRLRMAEAAYRRAHEEYSQDKMCERIEGVYKAALGR